MKPLVSIIMNCHNGSKFLRESLMSIFSQTYDNWELIFFDNNSNDDSKKILFSFKDRRIKYFYSSQLIKLYHARNEAINHSNGKYITFLDVDDLWVKEKLEKQIKYFEVNKNCKIIYSNYTILRDKNKLAKKRYNKQLPSGKITKELVNNYTIGILTTAIEKKIFNEFKFNDEYNIIGDFDFFIRLSKIYEIGCIQEPLSIYRLHDQNLSKKKIKENILEHQNWLKNNSDALPIDCNLMNLKIYILKLRLKYLFNNIGKLFFIR